MLLKISNLDLMYSASSQEDIFLFFGYPSQINTTSDTDENKTRHASTLLLILRRFNLVNRLVTRYC